MNSRLAAFSSPSVAVPLLLASRLDAVFFVVVMSTIISLFSALVDTPRRCS